MAWDALTEEQREIRELVRTLARERVAPRAAEIDESHEFPWDVVELFREHELFGLLFDEEWGGSGTGTLLALVAIEEVSKVCATSGLLLAVQELGSLGLKLAGSQEQKEALPAAARERRVAARLRADRGRLRLRLGRDADDRASATATSTSSTAASASSRTPASRASTPSSRRPIPNAGHSGISAFLVEADAPGFAVARLEPKMGISGLDDRRARPSTTAASRPANLLGEEGEGFKIAMRILDRSRPGRRRAGARDRAGRDRLRARVREDARDDGQADRGAPADPGQARRHGDGCEAARGLLYRFGQMCDEGVDDAELTKASAMAKLKCGDVAMEVTTEAVQILGGYGYIKEYPVERFMRDAKITQIYEGTQEVQRLVIAREMLRESRAFLLAGVG